MEKYFFTRMTQKEIIKSPLFELDIERDLGQADN